MINTTFSFATFQEPIIKLRIVTTSVAFDWFLDSNRHEPSSSDRGGSYRGPEGPGT